MPDELRNDHQRLKMLYKRAPESARPELGKIITSVILQADADAALRWAESLDGKARSYSLGGLYCDLRFSRPDFAFQVASIHRTDPTIQNYLIECAHDWGRERPDLGIDAALLIEDLKEQGLSIGGTLWNLASARPLDAVKLFYDDRVTQHRDSAFYGLTQGLRWTSIEPLLAQSPLSDGRKAAILSVHEDTTNKGWESAMRELIESFRPL